MALPRPALFVGLAVFASVCPAAGAAEHYNPWQLEIGDPARKARQAPLLLDAITDTDSGEIIAPSELARRLNETGILFIGENHTDADFHAVQLQTIRALHDAGREVLIGLEMLPYTEQKVLDDWRAGRYTESTFADGAHWYDNWGYHWNYYREIFVYARAQGLALYAINSPRDVIRSVRANGFDGLTPEQAAHFPPRIADDNDDHRRLYRSFFPADDALHVNATALDGLYRAQIAWDATLGWNALQALKTRGGPKSIMVVLIGAGHVSYGLGAERQIAPYFAGRSASLLPVPVLDHGGRPVKQVRASYANFIQGVPQEMDALYPNLGVSLMGNAGQEPGQIIQVVKGSVAERAGLRVGDVLLALNGTPITGEPALRRLMADVQWGDEVRVGLRRNAAPLDLQIQVRRSPPASGGN